MSGLAMQAHASSRPASGAEHQFSHLWEMEGLGADQRPPLSHGFKVGIGSIAVAALYERLLDRDLGDIDVDALAAAWPTADQVARDVEAVHSIDGVRTAAVAESLAKHVGPGAARRAAGAGAHPLAGAARTPRRATAPCGGTGRDAACRRGAVPAGGHRRLRGDAARQLLPLPDDPPPATPSSTSPPRPGCWSRASRSSSPRAASGRDGRAARPDALGRSNGSRLCRRDLRHQGP